MELNLENMAFLNIHVSLIKGQEIKYNDRKGVFLRSGFYSAICQGNQLIIPGIELIYSLQNNLVEKHFITYKKENSNEISFDNLTKSNRHDYKKLLKK